MRGLLVVALLCGACRGAPPPKPEPEPARAPRADLRYVGVDACGECHPTAWRDWTTVRHARGTVTLQTGMAMMVAERVGMPAEDLPENRMCLGCHGVGVRDGKDLDHGPASRPEEGVTCEACHGPASAHVAKARKGVKGPELVASLRRPTRACLDCHKHKASHEHERSRPFHDEHFRKEIAHGKEPAKEPEEKR